jgi:hypothetical protein
LRQDELREQLVGRLNGGQRGWNRDEAGVMLAACVLAVNFYFGPGYDVRSITELVSHIRETVMAGGGTMRGQLEMEAVIREALGESDIDMSGISGGVAFEVQGIVTAVIASKSGLSESRIDELLIEAERMAFARGLNPPLAV